ncbi:MAG: glycosyltransferase [Dehalococcoidia bacterium]|nr:glycosyltransferase [Dehalococcoidia bacterium]
MSSPKIIIATVARPSGTTGVQTHFNTFLGYLRQQGTESDLVTPFSYLKPLALAVFAVRSVVGPLSPSFSVWWFEKWHYLFLQRALRRVLKRQGPAIIYAQCPLSAKAALETRAGLEQRVVLVAHFNVSQAEEWTNLLGLPRGGLVYEAIRHREAEVLPRLDGIVHASSFVRDTIEDVIPAVCSVPALTLPNFVSSPAADEESGAGNDLISIGTLEARKNQAYLLRVLAEAKNLGRFLGLTVIGDGPSRAQLEALAETLGVEQQVRFLGYQKDARRFLPGHRVFVHAALTETFGIALIEAMASGLPICAGPTGGIPEVFTDGIEGLYWDLNDPHAGALKLISLLEDQELQSRMSQAGRSRFADHFETNKCAGRLHEFLLQC